MNGDLLPSEKVIKIASGNNHSLFLTNKGRVFSCGLNEDGQSGHKRNKNIPEVIPNLPKITEITCGSYSSMFLSEERKVFSCGSNTFGPCTLPSEIELLRDKMICNFSCGSFHCLFLSSNSCSLRHVRKGDLAVAL